MKRIICILYCVLTLCVEMSATGINDMYVQRTAGDESIFFILSQKVPVCKCSGLKAKPIDYDYTYVKKTDSVSMLMTVRIPVATKNLSVTISDENNLGSYSPEIIFVKPKGKFFDYRLRITMSFAEFENIYSSTTPFMIQFRFANSGKESDIAFCYNEKKWLDNREKMRKIIDMIKLNSNL